MNWNIPWEESVIKDKNTWLIWQSNWKTVQLSWSNKCYYEKPIWNNINKEYDYEKGRSKSDYPAFKYCEDLILWWYFDWKLPNKEELLSIKIICFSYDLLQVISKSLLGWLFK